MVEKPATEESEESEELMGDEEEALRGSWIEGLNEVQQEIVSDHDGAILVLAGAGSGKTRVLTTRIALMINSGIWSYRILAVTFTNKAANEMRERIGQMIGSSRASQVWIGTFHAIALRILRKHSDRLEFRNDFAILSQEDTRRVVKKLMQNRKIDLKTVSPKSVLWQIERWKDEGLEPHEARKNHLQKLKSERDEQSVETQDKTELDKDMVLDLYEDYQMHLRESEAMDFGDLLMYCLLLFKENQDIWEHYSKKFISISVDEYQDSNLIQRNFIIALGSFHNNVFCVGDEDQSIYGWRGANISNILEFCEDFPKAKIMRLEQNYRSTGNILTAASGLIANNRQRYGKTLWTDGEKGGPIQIMLCSDAYDEARRVSELVGKDRDVEQAILVRAGYQTRPFEEALSRQNIPYIIIGGLKFYERTEIRDIIAYLRVIVYPYDLTAFERVVNLPPRGVGPSRLGEIQRQADIWDCRFMEAVERMTSNEKPSTLSTEYLQNDLFSNATLGGQKTKSNGDDEIIASRGVVEFMKLVRKWREDLDNVTLPELVERIVEESGYRDMIVNKSDPISRETRLDNINGLKEAIYNFATLESFLDHVSLVAQNEPDSNDKVVNIMTIHSAKGLEFDKVFLPCWEVDLFPNWRAIREGREKGIEEERRLAYVALTRAKREVFISYVDNRVSQKQFVKSVPSQFINEIPSEVCKFTDFLVHRASPRERFSKSRVGLEYGGRGSSSKNFEVDMRCFHKRFGEGRILGINRDIITVQFDNDDIGRKVVISRFLESIENH